MRRKHMTMVFTGALAAAAAFGGTAAAGGDYPPGDTTGNTVLGVDAAQSEAVAAPAGDLPQTGGDSQVIVKLAAGGVLAGAGLVVVARRRRRPATA